ncbi:DsrE/DsrF/DrsH-like family protein [Phocicoccus pinnipedialis]|uniref:Thiosulfate sulfurtransferase GlpE n=1 Tax=Phocicoccus pinnipedialis TaxID=110845 RepID=A0A6V7R4Y2_9BACL|nr:DsrE/DsrF/DrsH-like family protein [Jeotgalicoccus pinnipedialis]MBP1939764.1 peroxiredoxin family protein/rhodanese-related sulfurtransferase/TusA-related sulfurtransferase [Jeotgalicoccus pinnipedialis]CAD2072386.1 Thiosulfate sulfurtransferase GlpE [Jeotgalicoccus pinnipedialis]
MESITKTYHINDVDLLKESGQFILDVREPSEFDSGHIEGAINIPLGEIDTRLKELPKDQDIFVYCQRGRRSEMAVGQLVQHGYNAINVEGGYSEYIGKYNVVSHSSNNTERKILQLGSLQCPGPLITVNNEMSKLGSGEQLEVHVDDVGFCNDVEAWAKKTGNKIIKNEVINNSVEIILEKNGNKIMDSTMLSETNDGTTMVVFSGDLDKALASFIIATGAKSMGKEVTMFFTFWGLNIIKDPNAPKVRKKGMDKLFSAMMPKSASKLPISKMNMFGLGSKMIQSVMKNKKVDALSEMIEKADKLGVKMIACTMSMDVMSIEKSELLPFVEYGGVGTYLGDTENSNLNLFI